MSSDFNAASQKHCKERSCPLTSMHGAQRALCPQCSVQNHCTKQSLPSASNVPSCPLLPMSFPCASLSSCLNTPSKTFERSTAGNLKSIHSSKAGTTRIAAALRPQSTLNRSDVNARSVPSALNTPPQIIARSAARHLHSMTAPKHCTEHAFCFVNVTTQLFERTEGGQRASAPNMPF